MKSTQERYISVDVESTGPVPYPYSMISFGACCVDNPHSTFYRELRPISRAYERDAIQVAAKGLLCLQDLKENPVYDPPHSSFDPLKVLDVLEKKGEDPIYAMRDFADWVEECAGEKRSVFVGFNAPFDWMFVNWYFHSFIGRNPFGANALDIKSLYKGKFGTTWSDTRKSQMPKNLLSGRPHTHNALEDAVEQAEIYRRIETARY